MSSSYDDYLTNHITAVNEAGDWLLQHCSDLLAGMNEIELRNQLLQHDESKYCSEEYDAYDHYFYFYSNNRSSKIVKNFNRAWLHHIHHNPHHWQHWVLIHDDEPMEPLEMPIECVVEMIADWWSFSYRAGNLYEILDWYEKHKSGMILHPKTKVLVERILLRIMTELDRKKEKN